MIFPNVFHRSIIISYSKHIRTEDPASRSAGLLTSFTVVGWTYMCVHCYIIYTDVTVQLTPSSTSLPLFHLCLLSFSHVAPGTDVTSHHALLKQQKCGVLLCTFFLLGQGCRISHYHVYLNSILHFIVMWKWKGVSDRVHYHHLKTSLFYITCFFSSLCIM